MTSRQASHRESGSREAPPTLVRSFDGSEVAVRSGGQGHHALLFCNAVGVNLAPSRDTLHALGRTRRWFSWDMRGLLDSPAPVRERPDPGSHAADAIAAADHLGIEKFAVLSWSNGGRNAFELAARHSDRVSALIVVNGSYGRPFNVSWRDLDPAAVLPLLAGAAKRVPAAAGAVLRQLVARPELAGLIRQSGLLRGSVDPTPLIESLKAMSACDTGRLLATFEAVAGSPATELLPSITAPTLLVTGGKDRLSPRGATPEMAELIPGARVISYEDATHYLPLEYATRLTEDVSAFLAESERSLG